MHREARSYDLFAPGLRDVWWYRCAVYGWRGVVAGVVYGFSAGHDGVMTGTPATVMLSIVLPSFAVVLAGHAGLIAGLLRAGLEQDRFDKYAAVVGMIRRFAADLLLYEVLWLIRRGRQR